MIATMEMGPRLETRAPDFCVLNHNSQVVTLEDLQGERGLVLGFTGDIWQPASVRRILWLQRHQPQFAKQGVNLALLICDKPHMLYGFSMSSVVPLDFPLLADMDRQVHTLYQMNRFAGLVIIDREGIMRDKWIMPDERVWPKAPELIGALELL